MKYISVSQTAKKMEVSKETVYNMLKDGRLGGRYTKGKGKKKGSWSVKMESIELLERYSNVESIYQLKEKK